MTTTVIRQKLSTYMQTADDKKIKAIYTIVEDEIETAANDWDNDFKRELERRSKAFKNGTSKAYTWEETKRAAIAKVKGKKK
ncbi:MAG: addiction module protein [Bacteroidota bacterium]